MTDCNAPARDATGRFAPVEAQHPAYGKCALIRETDGTPFRWRDPDGLIHATIEWPLDPDAPDIIGVTRCGRFDVPPRQSWSGREALTCRACAALEASSEADSGAAP